MPKAESLAQQLEELEREYQALFVQALAACASGRWGLFGHNDHLYFAGIPAAVDELRDLAATIDQIRARLGDAPFALHAEFEAARGPVGANAPGEAKQAQAWLERLART